MTLMKKLRQPVMEGLSNFYRLKRMLEKGYKLSKIGQSNITTLEQKEHVAVDGYSKRVITNAGSLSLGMLENTGAIFPNHQYFIGYGVVPRLVRLTSSVWDRVVEQASFQLLPKHKWYGTNENESYAISSEHGVLVGVGKFPFKLLTSQFKLNRLEQDIDTGILP